MLADIIYVRPQKFNRNSKKNQFERILTTFYLFHAFVGFMDSIMVERCAVANHHTDVTVRCPVYRWLRNVSTDYAFELLSCV